MRLLLELPLLSVQPPRTNFSLKAEIQECLSTYAGNPHKVQHRFWSRAKTGWEGEELT